MKCSYKPDLDCSGELRCSPLCFKDVFVKIGLIENMEMSDLAKQYVLRDKGQAENIYRKTVISRYIL